MSDRLAGLVPCPRSVRPLHGSLLLTAPVVVAGGHDGGPAQEPARAAAAVSRVLGSIPWPGRPAREVSGPSTGSQASAHSPDRPDSSRLTVDIAADLAQEAYRLTISQAGISIVAGGVAGAFYAAQTLRQLLPDDAWRSAPITAAPNPATAVATTLATGWLLPCAEIEDAPALAWRGAHLDVARHFFPKRELITLIDAFAALKLNRLHLHLTDDQGWRIESRRYPVLQEIGSHRPRTRINLSREQPPVYDETPHGGYYTLADLAEIAAYAAERMIEIVPEIEVPGHASALLAALPELGAGSPPPGGYQVSPDWGIFPPLMSPLPRTMEYLREIFGELLSAVPARYVHIGGDECVLDSWRDDPVIDAYRRQRGIGGTAELHAVFLREVADMLAADYGVRAVVWDEGFASAGGQRGMLRADTIVMAWRGMRIARSAAEAGHDVIAAPVLPTYFDNYQSDSGTEPVGIGGPVRVQDVAAFSPVPQDWPAPAQQRLLGTQFQVWTEYIRNSRELEYMIFPRACALADVAWAGKPVLDEAVLDGAVLDEAGTGMPPALAARLAAHLRRLDAAGLEYRPLGGPRPWQRGGTGPRRHRPGARVRGAMARLDELAAADGTALAASEGT
jgi:hexosaminidase